MILRSGRAEEWLTARGLTSVGSPEVVVDERALGPLRIMRAWHTPAAGVITALERSVRLVLQLDADTHVSSSAGPAPPPPDRDPSALRIVAGESFALAPGQAAGVAMPSDSARIEIDIPATGDFVAVVADRTPSLRWESDDSEWSRVALISLTNVILNIEREVRPADMPRLVSAFYSIAAVFLSRSSNPSIDRPWSRLIVERAEIVVERNGADPDFSVSRLAKELGITPTHLSRAFRAEGGRTPGQALREFRRSLALSLLDEHRGAGRPDWSDVATRAGFGSVDSLRRALRAPARRSSKATENGNDRALRQEPLPR